MKLQKVKAVVIAVAMAAGMFNCGGFTLGVNAEEGEAAAGQTVAADGEAYEVAEDTEVTVTSEEVEREQKSSVDEGTDDEALTAEIESGQVEANTASSSLYPAAYDNTALSLRRFSDLTATGDGYMRVFYDGTKIGIEYYDDSFNIKSKRTLGMELGVWGGFYAGSDGYYYIVEGQHNEEEDDSKEIMRVIKYDSGWNRVGAASITGNSSLFGGVVGYIFDYGCVEMAEYGSKLYVVTGHEGYVDSLYGQGHQGFLMACVDKNTMTGSIVKSDLWHSFAQYIEAEGSDLYVLEQSEGSRYTKLSKYSADTLSGTSIPVLKYGGSRDSAWAISCYASVDDLALSANNVLALGTSIDQSLYDSVSSDTAHNIYLTVTPKSNFTSDATTVKWITNYSGDGKSFYGTKITKVNDNRFLITWEEYGASQTAAADDTLSSSILHYVFVDGNGNKVSQEFTAAATLSDCHPVVKGSKIVYYASNANMVDFYSIDAQTGAFTKKCYRVAGENAAWDLTNGVLTISGTGAISMDSTAKQRYPASSASIWYSYYSSDNCWKAIRDNVTKIVIKSGITEIPKNAFNYLSNLEEVVIESGVQTIGEEAFAYCKNLTKITIPSTVTSIGDDIVWDGYYWYSGGHVYNATIYADSGSVAEQYAKTNGITCNTSGAGTGTDTWTSTSTIQNTSPSDVDVSYRTHVQSKGWEKTWVTNGGTSGTVGSAKRLEAICISVSGNDNLGIQYTTHCQSYGWLPWSSNGGMNGTEGEAKRLEAIKIQLTGADKDKYDVYYRVHAQSYGWLNWAKNGEPAGTAGYAKRLEAIQIVVVNKGESINTTMGGITSKQAAAYVSQSGSAVTVGGSDTTNVVYRTHVQTYGWQGWKYNGAVSGTSGMAKRLEGIRIRLANQQYSGGITYRTHIQTYGWEKVWRNDGEMSGTTGEAKRLEAIQIQLTGEMAEHYDVYYRVHAQSYGWLGWAKNGESAGTAGYAKRLEAIQIVLVPKGDLAPAANYGGVISKTTVSYVQK